MPKVKRYRWVCLGDHPGILAPSRMRQKDIRRYCLDCSIAAGELVERFCPSLDRLRQAADDRRKARDKRKRVAKRRARDRNREARAQWIVEREIALGFTQDGGKDTIQSWFRQLRRLKAWGCKMSHCSLRVRYSDTDRHAHPWTSGHAWLEAGEIVITAAKPRAGYPTLRQKAEVIQTLLHELAHPAAFGRFGHEAATHGWEFKRTLIEAAEELTGRVADVTVDHAVYDVDQEVVDMLHLWLMGGETDG
jgi:predicted SprT family Zn-dependent metalloprotease